MKKLLLTLGFLLGLAAPAMAQTACGGVNFVPSAGVTCLLEPTVNSFGATSVGLVTAASATDVACITGSATKVIRVQLVRLSGSAGTLVNVPVTITKHASANSGGTPAVGTALPVPYALDSTDAAATATTTAYTANPTINDSAPGIVDNLVLPLSLTGTTLGSPGVSLDYTERNFMQTIVLRGVAQQACVNFNSTTVSSGVVNITFRWTEAAS